MLQTDASDRGMGQYLPNKMTTEMIYLSPTSAATRGPILDYRKGMFSNKLHKCICSDASSLFRMIIGLLCGWINTDYSKASDKGPSEKWTISHKGHFVMSQKVAIPIVIIHFETSEKRTASLQWTHYGWSQSVLYSEVWLNAMHCGASPSWYNMLVYTTSI